MYVKIMGPEPLPDSDPSKTFQIYGRVRDVSLHRRANGTAFVRCTFDDNEAEDFDAPGTVYLMNENGKTIGTFGSATAGLDLRSADDV